MGVLPVFLEKLFKETYPDGTSPCVSPESRKMRSPVSACVATRAPQAEDHWMGKQLVAPRDPQAEDHWMRKQPVAPRAPQAEDRSIG